jgi:hypothetical protein
MDRLTPTETLECAIGGEAGNLKVPYELLESLCGGAAVDGALITPTLRCTIWRTGKSFPTVKHAKSRILGFMDLKPGDTLSIEPISGSAGRVRVVPVVKGCPSLYTPQPRPWSSRDAGRITCKPTKPPAR